MIRWAIGTLRRFTVDQWRAIDADWIDSDRRGDGDDDDDDTVSHVVKGKTKSKGKSKGKKGKVERAAAAPKRGFDFRPLVVLIVVAVSLSLQEYFGERTTYMKFYPPDNGEYWLLGSFAWWSGWRFLGYVIIPVIAIWCMPGERVRDYFIDLKNFFKHLWIYAILFVIVVPAVLVASQMDSFLATYPFYKLSNRSVTDFLIWEALYILQFFSLEFFFRGFMLKALAPRFGSGAIFVMIVPYCMIHFGKPLPETLLAIVAGTALGTLALRTRSIWGGVLIHCAVAISMDVLALQNCPAPEVGPCPSH